MRFDKGVKIVFGTIATGKEGAMVVEGTSGNPVILTSAAGLPAPGDWVGLIFHSPAGTAYNLIEHARIEYAGGDSGHSGHSCATENDYGDDGAVIIANWAPVGSFVVSTEIRHSASHGIVRGWDEPGGPDFAASNTFTNVAGCKQTNPRYPDCPACLPAGVKLCR